MMNNFDDEAASVMAYNFVITDIKNKKLKANIPKCNLLTILFFTSSHSLYPVLHTQSRNTTAHSVVSINP